MKNEIFMGSGFEKSKGCIFGRDLEFPFLLGPR